jgi:hypothetical protein
LVPLGPVGVFQRVVVAMLVPGEVLLSEVTPTLS